MKCLNCWNFVTAHALLTGRQLAYFHLFYRCTILVYSICHTGFLLHLGRFHHCKLGEFLWRTQFQIDFIFYAVLFSRETLQTLAWIFLFCVSQKVFGVYIFPYFVFVQYIVVQSLVKTSPRCVYTFCLSLFSSDIQLFELIEKRS